MSLIVKIRMPEELKELLIETSDALETRLGESIRMHLLYSLIEGMRHLYPDYQPMIDIFSQHKSILEECRNKCFDIAKRKKFIADLYIEFQNVYNYHQTQKEKKFV